MLSEVKSMLFGHLGRIIISKHGIELMSSYTCPACCAPYQAHLNMQEFEQIKMGRMLAMNFIDPAKTLWIRLIAFPPKMDGLLCFCFDDWSQNSLSVRSLLFNSENGWRYSFLRWQDNFFNNRRQQWQQESENGWQGPKKTAFKLHKAFLDSIEAFLVMERAEDVPTQSGRLTFSCKLAIRARLPRQHFHFLFEPQTAH